MTHVLETQTDAVSCGKRRWRMQPGPKHRQLVQLWPQPASLYATRPRNYGNNQRVVARRKSHGIAKKQMKIAIVGVAAQLPSGDFSPDDLGYRTFWDFLVAKGQVYQPLSPDLFMFVTVDATLRWSRPISAVRGERKTQNRNTETGRRFAPKYGELEEARSSKMARAPVGLEKFSVAILGILPLLQ
ncbi:hypothetical protein B0H14DRAFT_3156288 [Mycena olivaceomarginata]|nr:hypothetical protein B0H14DRAFT_3156288 [Mycena olivaceomarginata]